MFAVTLFCIFAANDVLVALNQSYSSLGLLLIPIFAGSMVVFLPLAFFARTKKLACLLGISAVGATLMVDGAVFYVTDPPREYVGAAYGGAFLLCMFVQMCTGRGQRHLTAAQQDRYREEQALGAVSGDAAYTPLAADALESGGAPVGGAGGVGAGGSVGYAALPRQSNEQVFGASTCTWCGVALLGYGGGYGACTLTRCCGWVVQMTASAGTSSTLAARTLHPSATAMWSYPDSGRAWHRCTRLRTKAASDSPSRSRRESWAWG